MQLAYSATRKSGWDLRYGQKRHHQKGQRPHGKISGNKCLHENQMIISYIWYIWLSVLSRYSPLLYCGVQKLFRGLLIYLAVTISKQDLHAHLLFECFLEGCK